MHKEKEGEAGWDEGWNDGGKAKRPERGKGPSSRRLVVLGNYSEEIEGIDGLQTMRPAP